MWWVRPAAARVRRLQLAEREPAAQILDAAPIETVLMRDYLDSSAPFRPYATSHFVGYFGADGRMLGVCWVGANIIPWGFDEHGLDELARYLRRTRHYSNSIVGERRQVMGLWERMKLTRMAPREVREHQASMVYRSGHALVEGDPSVRLARVDEADLVFPAAVAMFTEEVGYDPAASGNAYRQRVENLIEERRTYIRVGEDPFGHARVEFKADVGALSAAVAQIQGVWVAPDLRGRGIATRAMVSVAELAQSAFGAQVSLYVNDYNLAALRAYERAGFETIGEYSTVML